nr:PREDICTED: coiled-coil-helix-coiled-coil-helix domain-containing protein 3, mitochondrial [Struthio camelus australis]
MFAAIFGHYNVENGVRPFRSGPGLEPPPQRQLPTMSAAALREGQGAHLQAPAAGTDSGKGGKSPQSGVALEGAPQPLSENVVDRMKEPSSPSGRPQSQHRSASGAVNDEELKKRIAEELALDRARRETEAQKRRLRQEQTYVRDEFGKLLERERIASNEHLTRAILRERAATEEERQKAQRFEIEQKAKQLEEKDRELKKHDAYYKEQLARLEERSAQFYKVTTEQYQKAADEVAARFKQELKRPFSVVDKRYKSMKFLALRVKNELPIASTG